MRGIPWLRIVRLAALGTVAVTIAVLVNVSAEGGNPVGLIQPGVDGPSAEVFAEDFPELDIPDGIGHDGQQFYVIAREPMHPDDVSDDLDRPRYRLQRPLFPVLAWALHPTGGGYGLVYALLAVGVASVFLFGVATGALSTQLRGPAWPALLAPILPGSYAALRLTLADTLALGLALGTLFLAERGRTASASLAGVLAVLAKESILVVLVGHAVFRRTRASVVAAATSAATTAIWWLALHVLVDADSRQILEFTWPFGGVIANLGDWFSGEDWTAGVTVVVSFLLAAVALVVRGPRHRLFGALAAVSLFSVFLGVDVFGPAFNGTRTIAPVLVMAILVWVTPRQPTEDESEAGNAVDGSVTGRPDGTRVSQ